MPNPAEVPSASAFRQVFVPSDVAVVTIVDDVESRVACGGLVAMNGMMARLERPPARA